MTQRALWVAKTGLDAQQTRMAIISNNLANVNTTGFKKSRALFQDLLYQNVRQVGAQSTQNTILPTGLQVGTGVRSVATQKLHTQGNIQQTQNSMDVAINGRGFFQVLTQNGTINYTRNGEFQVNNLGQIVTAGGQLIQPVITVPINSTSVTIGRDGTVSVQQPGSPTAVQVGQIQTAVFMNPAGLEPVGQNMFAQTYSSGPPVLGIPNQNEFGPLFQGSLETSNVNVVEELVNMIETQRTYEMNSKAISTTNQMLQFATQQL